MTTNEIVAELQSNLRLQKWLQAIDPRYLEPSSYRRTSMQNPINHSYWYEFIQIPCPICHKKGLCIIDFMQAEIMCGRSDTWNGIQGIEIASNGTHKFSIFKDNQPQHYAQHHDVICVRPNVKHASLEITDQVYRLVLKHGEHYLLNDEQHDLKKRGLSDSTIQRLGFCDKHFVLVQGLKDTLMQGTLRYETSYQKWLTEAGLQANDWQGVAGFYSWQHQEKIDDKIVTRKTVLFAQHQSHYPSEVYAFPTIPKQDNAPLWFTEDKTYFIPVLNIDNQVTALCERHLDSKSAKYTWVSSANNVSGGVSPLSLTNVALIPSLAKRRGEKAVENWLLHAPKTVIVTEGILKSICIAELLEKRFDLATLKQLGAVVIGNGGVSMYRKFLPLLYRLHATNVLVAYDMDYQNNASVLQSTEKLIAMLKHNHFNVGRIFWDQANKGLDDCLLNQPQLTVKYM